MDAAPVFGLSHINSQPKFLGLSLRIQKPFGVSLSNPIFNR